MKELNQDNHKELAGLQAPVVDFNKCEAQGLCVEVCPYGVFEMKTISKTDFNELSLIGKLKSRFHDNRKAYAVNPELCHSCGLCVVLCPENAIKLKKIS